MGAGVIRITSKEYPKDNMSLILVRWTIWSKRFFWIKKWSFQDNDVKVTQCCFNGCFLVGFFLLSKPYYTEWIMYNVSTISLHSNVFWTHIKRYKQVYILQIISSRNKRKTRTNQILVSLRSSVSLTEKKFFWL